MRRRRQKRYPEKGIKLINILITLFNYFNGGRTPNNNSKKKYEKENWLNNGIYLITITKYFYCFMCFVVKFSSFFFLKEREKSLVLSLKLSWRIYQLYILFLYFVPCCFISFLFFYTNIKVNNLFQLKITNQQLCGNFFTGFCCSFFWLCCLNKNTQQKK